MLKKCSKCKETKDTTMFHVNRSRKDGLAAYCKDCTKKYHSTEKAKLYMRNYMRIRTLNDPEFKEKKRQREKIWLDKMRELGLYKKIFKKAYLRYSKINSHKIRARNKLTRSLGSGTIQRLPCNICGSKNSEAHHSNYKKPLDVVWLCRKHHRELHANINNTLFGLDQVYKLNNQ